MAYHIIYRVLYIPGGARFHLNTPSIAVFWVADGTKLSAVPQLSCQGPVSSNRTDFYTIGGQYEERQSTIAHANCFMILDDFWMFVILIWCYVVCVFSLWSIIHDFYCSRYDYMI